MFKKIVITLSLLLSLAACSSSEKKEQPAKVYMANPAAEFCAERGVYDLDSGNCILGNGDIVNGWEYYRSHKQEMTKPVGKANPAAVYCIEQQGSYNLENSDCTLKTGEVVNAWDFYKSNQ